MGMVNVGHSTCISSLGMEDWRKNIHLLARHQVVVRSSQEPLSSVKKVNSFTARVLKVAVIPFNSFKLNIEKSLHFPKIFIS